MDDLVEISTCCGPRQHDLLAAHISGMRWPCMEDLVILSFSAAQRAKALKLQFDFLRKIVCPG